MTTPRLVIGSVDHLASRIDDFVAERSELTGLELYYELERATTILEFHTMIREGERNRERNGLQQSYGDHNRLLMLGLDRLLAGDVDWFRGRLDGHGEVSDAALCECVATAAGLAPPRGIAVALWLAAALHDCGMLCGRGAYVDVEDGVVLSREALEALCPAEHRALARCVLRHHDYVKGVFLGEVPASTVAGDVATLDPALQPLALAALGMIQVAGSASLGEGRLGRFRIEIFDRCVAGDALADTAVVTRLARLLEEPRHAAAPAPDGAERALARLDPRSRTTVETLLAGAAVHAWQRTTAHLDPDARLDLLVALADRWAGSGADDLVLDAPPGVTDLPVDDAALRVDTALSGVRLLLVRW